MSQIGASSNGTSSNGYSKVPSPPPSPSRQRSAAVPTDDKSQKPLTATSPFAANGSTSYGGVDASANDDDDTVLPAVAAAANDTKSDTGSVGDWNDQSSLAGSISSGGLSMQRPPTRPTSTEPPSDESASRMAALRARGIEPFPESSVDQKTNGHAVAVSEEALDTEEYFQGIKSRILPVQWCFLLLTIGVAGIIGGWPYIHNNWNEGDFSLDDFWKIDDIGESVWKTLCSLLSNIIPNMDFLYTIFIAHVGAYTSLQVAKAVVGGTFMTSPMSVAQSFSNKGEIKFDGANGFTFCCSIGSGAPLNIYMWLTELDLNKLKGNLKAPLQKFWYGGAHDKETARVEIFNIMINTLLEQVVAGQGRIKIYVDKDQDNFSERVQLVLQHFGRLANNEEAMSGWDSFITGDTKCFISNRFIFGLQALLIYGLPLTSLGYNFGASDTLAAIWDSREWYSLLPSFVASFASMGMQYLLEAVATKRAVEPMSNPTSYNFGARWLSGKLLTLAMVSGSGNFAARLFRDNGASYVGSSIAGNVGLFYVLWAATNATNLFVLDMLVPNLARAFYHRYSTYRLGVTKSYMMGALEQTNADAINNPAKLSTVFEANESDEKTVENWSKKHPRVAHLIEKFSFRLSHTAAVSPPPPISVDVADEQSEQISSMQQSLLPAGVGSSDASPSPANPPSL